MTDLPVVIGRIFPSWAADHVGRYNMAIIFSFLSTTVVWAFWIPLHNSVAGIVVFAVLYGIFSGAVIALTPALVAQIVYVLEAFKDPSDAYSQTDETCF